MPPHICYRPSAIHPGDCADCIAIMARVEATFRRHP